MRPGVSDVPRLSSMCRLAATPICSANLWSFCDFAIRSADLLGFSFTFVSSRKFRLDLVSSKLRLINYLKKLLSSQLVL